MPSERIDLDHHLLSVGEATQIVEMHHMTSSFGRRHHLHVGKQQSVAKEGSLLELEQSSGANNNSLLGPSAPHSQPFIE